MKTENELLEMRDKFLKNWEKDLKEKERLNNIINDLEKTLYRILVIIKRISGGKK